MQVGNGKGEAAGLQVRLHLGAITTDLKKPAACLLPSCLQVRTQMRTSQPVSATCRWTPFGRCSGEQCCLPGFLLAVWFNFPKQRQPSPLLLDAVRQVFR